MGSGWSIAWRVFDAQFWGVPQRRRRIALVADFDGLDAAQVLFERDSGSGDRSEVRSVREGLSGDSEPGGAAREGAAGDSEGGTYPEIAGTLSARFDGSPQPDKGNGAQIVCIQGNCIDRADTAGCNGRGWRDDGNSYTLNTIDRPAVCYSFDSLSSNSMKSPNPHSGCRKVEQAKTLDASPPDPSKNQGGIAVVYGLDQQGGKGGANYTEDVAPTIASDSHGTPHAVVYDARGNGDGEIVPTITGDHEGHVSDYTALCVGNGQADNTKLSDVCPALSTMHDQQAVLCFQNTGHGWWNQSDIGATIRTPVGGDSNKANLIAAVDCRNGTENAEVNGTLQAKPNGGMNLNSQNVCRVGWKVRRLTPTECERLQGYPDGWTNIGDWIDSKGKKHKTTDSARYRALGNSIGLPSWFWMLSRLNGYCREHTMASLFDGIGGFPLIWEHLNGRGSCLWASEIEEFCIAVTKKRFGEE